jgi:methylmalonyl-CoA/ethylmalonyl-CoA epimerase
MAIEGLDHVAVAVRDLDAALRLYRDTLGFEMVGRESVEGMKVEVAMLRAGDFHLELVRPKGEDSPVARFLEKRGEGIHHVALKVDGIAEVLKELQEAGLALIDRAPRHGAGGSLVAFLHPGACHGALIELCERSRD